MKVAVVTHFPVTPESPVGGVEAVSVNLCRALSRFNDLDLHVVTVDRKCSLARQVNYGNFCIHYLPYLGGSTLVNAIRRGRAQVQQYLRRLSPDLIHAHDTYGLMVRGMEFPRVFTIHGFIYGDTLVSGTRAAWLRSQLWRHFEVRGWADQPHIISISPYVRERLTGLTHAQIHDIDNPISESFFDIAARQGNPQDPVVIFSAAVIEPRKNTLALVQGFANALRAGANARLRLAGPVTNENYGLQVRKTVEELGIQKHVDFPGSLPSSRIREELAGAGVFALVSLEENSPLGVEEAMAAGVPVVTSNRCGMPYMVRHGESGFLVNPLQPEDIGRRLLLLCCEREVRAKMGKNAQATARERFHPAAVAARTREVYREILQSASYSSAGSEQSPLRDTTKEELACRA